MKERGMREMSNEGNGPWEEWTPGLPPTGCICAWETLPSERKGHLPARLNFRPLLLLWEFLSTTLNCRQIFTKNCSPGCFWIHFLNIRILEVLQLTLWDVWCFPVWSCLVLSCSIWNLCPSLQHRIHTVSDGGFSYRTLKCSWWLLFKPFRSFRVVVFCFLFFF